VATGRSDDRIRKTRPLQKLSVGMIVKDAENDLGRCLATIYKVADEIVIGDTGSTDTTKQIAASYGARVLDLPASRITRKALPASAMRCSRPARATGSCGSTPTRR
jgi:glycosyltransferase involved in cell wall biosynthesis